MDDFNGGERLDVQFGILGVDGAEHIGVVIEFEIGVEAADHVQLCRTGLAGECCLVFEILCGELVSAVLASLAIEVAELAGKGADV